jgi:hypothetical protein
MNIIIICVINIILLFIAAGCISIGDEFSFEVSLSKVLFSIFTAITIWISIAITIHTSKETFVKKIPVFICDKVAIAVYESNLINCTDNFKTQFNPGDSICVFISEETWAAGTQWSGGSNSYRINKK